MTSNSSFLSLLYYLGYPGAMVSWYGDETFQLFFCLMKWFWMSLLYLWIKLLKWPGRSNCFLLWGGTPFGRSSSTRGACGTRRNGNVRMHQKYKSKKNVSIKGLIDRKRKSWILPEKVARVPQGKICLLLCLTDPKKLAGPKLKNRPWRHFFSYTDAFLSEDLLFIVSLPWHQVRYCSIWKWNHEKPLVFTVFLEAVQGYYWSKPML